MPPASRAQARAPAAPPLPPEVETSTSVLARSRPTRRLDSPGRTGLSLRERKMRASSISAAVPERSASPWVRTESRCASTTMRRADRPGRTPTTVVRSRRPSTVRPAASERETRKPFVRSAVSTRPATPRSPSEPGRREGNALPSSRSESRTGARPGPNARESSKAWAASREVAGAGRFSSAKATTNSATSAGRNAAR